MTKLLACIVGALGAFSVIGAQSPAAKCLNGYECKTVDVGSTIFNGCYRVQLAGDCDGACWDPDPNQGTRKVCVTKSGSKCYYTWVTITVNAVRTECFAVGTTTISCRCSDFLGGSSSQTFNVSSCT
jgi:hypothetical protein